MMNAEEVVQVTEIPDEVQRWTAKRKVALVMSVVKGETSSSEAARKHGLTVAEVERWKEQFFAAGENALRARAKDEDAAKDEEIRRLKCKVGELVLESDILKEAVKGRPFEPRTSDE
jgi:transposase-like protein